MPYVVSCEYPQTQGSPILFLIWFDLINCTMYNNAKKMHHHGLWQCTNDIAGNGLCLSLVHMKINSNAFSKAIQEIVWSRWLVSGLCKKNQQHTSECLWIIFHLLWNEALMQWQVCETLDVFTCSLLDAWKTVMNHTERSRIPTGRNTWRTT